MKMYMTGMAKTDIVYAYLPAFVDILRSMEGGNAMVTVFLRTVGIYVFLLLAMRVMGKRQVGELQLGELIVTFMLSELAVAPIADPSVPLLYAIIPILTLLSIELFLSFSMLHSSHLKRMLSGSPAVLMHHGKLDQKALLDNRLEIEELLMALRQAGIASLADVQYVILEENGKLSIFPKAGHAPLTGETMQNGVTETGIAHPVVVDGEIDPSALRLAGRDEHWLMAELKRRRLELGDVFLMTIDDGGTVEVYQRRK